MLSLCACIQYRMHTHVCCIHAGHSMHHTYRRTCIYTHAHRVHTHMYTNAIQHISRIHWTRTHDKGALHAYITHTCTHTCTHTHNTLQTQLKPTGRPIVTCFPSVVDGEKKTINIIQRTGMKRKGRRESSPQRTGFCNLGSIG